MKRTIAPLVAICFAIGIAPVAATAADRQEALRTCNRAVEKMPEYTWGVRASNRYSACMAWYGQVD